MYGGILDMNATAWVCGVLPVVYDCLVSYVLLIRDCFILLLRFYTL